MAKDKYIIQSLRDGLELIETLVEHSVPLVAYSTAEIAEMTGMDYNKVFRICRTLVALGWMQEDKTGKCFLLSRYFFSLPGYYLQKLKAQHDSIAQEILHFNREMQKELPNGDFQEKR